MIIWFKKFTSIFLCLLFSSFLISFAKDYSKNVLLIVIDTLRRDHLSCYGYFRRTSPTIDKLAKEGIFFTDVISQSSQTAPSIASLFTGLYPHNHGVYFYSYNQSFHPLNKDSVPKLSEQFTTMAEYFQAEGYITLGVVSNPWLKADFGYAQGFKFYEYIESWNGKYINSIFKRYLNNQLKKKKFFAYLHYMDVHAPYYNPETFKALYTEYKGDHIYGNGFVDVINNEDLEYSVALYDESINYVDNLIKEIIEELNRNNLLENTIIILTSDHGEEFYEHFGLGHGTSLYQEQINTFFIIYNPYFLNSKKISRRVRLINLLPTVLDILNIHYDKNSMDGMSLFPVMSQNSNRKFSEYIFSELGDKKALLFKNWKYIYNSFLKTEELYNLNTDKREILNQIDRERKLRKRFKTLILNYSFQEFNLQEKINKIPTNLIPQLKSLGYLGNRSFGENQLSNNILKPIRDEVDFNKKSYNPIQLIYGWKKLEKKNNKFFYWIGPKTMFVLMRKSKKQNKLIIKGNLILKNFPNKIQKIILLCERRKLGEYILDKEGPFSICFKVPPNLGFERALEFTLLCRNYFKEKDFNLSLMISSIYFK